MDGARWRVGHGKCIQILDQHWLLLTDYSYITSNSYTLKDITVASLFCMKKKEWDLDIIRDVFNDRDQKVVLDIQLNEACTEDILYWRLEESGMYPVKSAYK